MTGRHRGDPTLSTTEWVAAMTDAEWAAVAAKSRRTRAAQGLPERLPPDAIERVRQVFIAAALTAADRASTPPPAGPDPVLLRARRQALLGDLIEVSGGDGR